MAQVYQTLDSLSLLVNGQNTREVSPTPPLPAGRTEVSQRCALVSGRKHEYQVEVIHEQLRELNVLFQVGAEERVHSSGQIASPAVESGHSFRDLRALHHLCNELVVIACRRARIRCWSDFACEQEELNAAMGAIEQKSRALRRRRSGGVSKVVREHVMTLRRALRQGLHVLAKYDIDE